MGEYFYSEKFNIVYSGKIQEGDRIATTEEISYWEEHKSTVTKDRENKNNENNSKYSDALQKPLSCGEYFVIADWMNTYTNTYTFAKCQEEAGIETNADIVVFDKTGKLVTITIKSITDFEPYYNIVSKEWARITDIRNKYMVAIQNTDEPNSIEIKY